MFHRGGIIGIRQVVSLAALHHVDKGSGIHVTAVRGSLFASGCLAALTPEVTVADVMVIGKAHGRAVFEKLGKLNTVLKPAEGVLIMVVGLVTSKEDQIRIEGA